MNALANAVLFQIGWFASVLGAAAVRCRQTSSMPRLKSIPTTRSRQSGRRISIPAPVPQQMSRPASNGPSGLRCAATRSSRAWGVRKGV